MSTLTRCPLCDQPVAFPPGTTYACVTGKALVVDEDLARVMRITDRTMEKGDEADGR